MDGVISDTQKIHSTVESELLLKYGIRLSPEEITRRFSGVSGRDMWPAIFKDAGVSCPSPEVLSDQVWNSLMSRPINEIVAMPGAIDFITWLRRKSILLGVASGSRPAFIERVLGTLKLRSEFHTITSAKEVVHGKPAPDVFMLAASRLGIAPDECVVIEDGINGMLAARAAGMYCIALVSDSDTYPADLVVRDFIEIPNDLFAHH